MTPGELARLESLEAQMGLMTALRGDMIGSLGNWVSYFARTGAGGSMNLPNTQSAASNTCFAALTLRAQTSGMFLVWATYNWADSTTGDSITARLAVTDATPGVLAGTNFQANGFTGANALGAQSGVLSADAAGGAGITIDGTGFGAIGNSAFVASYTSGSLTGLLTANGNGTFTYSFVGIVGKNNASPKAPVTIGHRFGAGLVLSATNTITIASISFGAVELPVG